VVRLSKVYVLIETWDYADDGFTIKGVFATLKALRDYVAINHAEFTLDDDGDYSYKDKDNKFTDCVYLSIYEEELIIKVKPKVNNTKPLAEQQEGGNGLPPTDKSVGIPPKIL